MSKAKDADDEECKPHFTSEKAILELRKGVDDICKPGRDSTSATRRQQRVQGITSLLDFFQEDPQLLDPQLSSLLPPLVSACLHAIREYAFRNQRRTEVSKLEDISNILCAFCKVRGRKVVSRFLDNDPQAVEPLLRTYDALILDQPSRANTSIALQHELLDETASSSSPSPWQKQYIIILWLSHLALTPFDLLSLSENERFNGNLEGLQVSPGVPLVALNMLKVGVKSLSSATSQRVVGADLLLRLSLRPDMLKLGLQCNIIEWALRELKAPNNISNGIHRQIGLLTFLSSIFASGALDDIGASMSEAYDKVLSLFSDCDGSNEALQDSAVAKRLAIKIQRNFVVQLLQHRETRNPVSRRIVTIMLESRSVLEDVIDHLLQSLADRDTQVRLAAAKALSMIAQNLDQEMADEIVEAVIGSLNEDVLEDHGTKSYAAVNALRWHGLTMTLSHLLFRRTPSSGQLRETVGALYMALTFDQRSSSGHSIGGNVRDAANFGLWSLARRYSTRELCADASADAIVSTARHLVCAACLDPVGNVRRGSSAGLQELVGRHPDTIENGIALIQAIDYQGVALRSRAMESIAPRAAELSESFRDALIEGLYSWRGTSALDQPSRESAASSLGKLATLQTEEDHVTHFEKCAEQLKHTSRREVEARHGLLLALSEILQSTAYRGRTVKQLVEQDVQVTQTRIKLRSKQIRDHPYNHLGLSLSELKYPNRRPDLIAVGVINLVKILSRISQDVLFQSLQPEGYNERTNDSGSAGGQILDLFTQALQVVQHDHLELVQGACRYLLSVESGREALYMGDFERGFPSKLITGLVERWLNTMNSSPMLIRVPGIQIALGAAWRALDSTQEHNNFEHYRQLQAKIIDSLVRNAKPPTEIEARATAIRALRLVLPKCRALKPDRLIPILESLHAALTDFTVNERGDVGSVVRSEALKACEDFWSISNYEPCLPLSHECYINVLTLAIGKLDKIRIEAAEALKFAHSLCSWSYPMDRQNDTSTICSYGHFHTMAALLESPSRYAPSSETPHITEEAHADQELLGVLEGFAISAGSSSSSTLPAAREALIEVLDRLPSNCTYGTGESVHRTLHDVANGLSTLLSANLTNDRVLVPLLDTMAFLFDFGLLQRLCKPKEPPRLNQLTPFNFRKLLSLVQKSHFKSTNVPKLLAAVDVYSGLAEISEIRVDVLSKLASMLLHPFPKVRNMAAEALWVATGDETLKPRVWSDAPAQHKTFVAEFREKYVEGLGSQ